MHRGERREAEAVADFLEARRVAVLLDELVQVVENLALPFGERKHATSNGATLYAKERRKSKGLRKRPRSRRGVRCGVRLSLRSRRPGDAAFDVAGFGLNSVDLLAVVAEYPAVNCKQRLQRVTRLPGGQIATAMATCAKLGWRASYIGQFRRRRHGHPVTQQPDRSRRGRRRQPHGPGCHERVCHHPCRRPLRASARCSGIGIPPWRWDPDDIPRQAVTAGRMLIVDCHETAAATQAARYAREAGVRPSSTSKRSGRVSGNCFSTSTSIIAAQDFPARADRLRRSRPRARRDGATSSARLRHLRHAGRAGQPGLVRRPSRSARRRFKWTAWTRPAQATSFGAPSSPACLRLPDADIEDVLAYANAAAALNCRALGARAGIPTPAEVDDCCGAPVEL